MVVKRLIPYGYDLHTYPVDSMPPTMAEDQNRTFPDQYMLRMPRGMRDALKALAKTNNRSMNAEILSALGAWLERDDLQHAESLDAAETLHSAMLRFMHSIVDAARIVPPDEMHRRINESVLFDDSGVLKRLEKPVEEET